MCMFDRAFVRVNRRTRGELRQKRVRDGRRRGCEEAAPRHSRGRETDVETQRAAMTQSRAAAKQRQRRENPAEFRAMNVETRETKLAGAATRLKTDACI